MTSDIRVGLRLLWKDKAFTLTAALTLALCIGANTALFSAVDAMLLTRIPVRDADTLVRFRWVGRNDMVTSSSDYGSINTAAYGGQRVRTTFSYPMYRQFVSDNRTMTDLFACAPFGRVSVVVDGQVGHRGASGVPHVDVVLDDERELMERLEAGAGRADGGRGAGDLQVGVLIERPGGGGRLDDQRAHQPLVAVLDRIGLGEACGPELDRRHRGRLHVAGIPVVGALLARRRGLLAEL